MRVLVNHTPVIKPCAAALYAFQDGAITLTELNEQMALLDAHIEAKKAQDKARNKKRSPATGRI